MAECIDLIDLVDDSDSDSDQGTAPSLSTHKPSARPKESPSVQTTSTNDSDDDVIEVLSPLANGTSTSTPAPCSSIKPTTQPSLLDSSDVLEFGLDDFLGTTPAPPTSSVSRFSASTSVSSSTSATIRTLRVAETEISLSSINQRWAFPGIRFVLARCHLCVIEG